eukprot:359340-Chlamydomonas_euryale.AAC.2
MHARWAQACAQPSGLAPSTGSLAAAAAAWRDVMLARRPAWHWADERFQVADTAQAPARQPGCPRQAPAASGAGCPRQAPAAGRAGCPRQAPAASGAGRPWQAPAAGRPRRHVPEPGPLVWALAPAASARTHALTRTRPGPTARAAKPCCRCAAALYRTRRCHRCRWQCAAVRPAPEAAGSAAASLGARLAALEVPTDGPDAPACAPRAPSRPAPTAGADAIGARAPAAGPDSAASIDADAGVCAAGALAAG